LQNEIVVVKDVSFKYKSHHHEQQDIKALKNINLTLTQGQFIVIIGRNGSGKSTLSRLFNALHLPTEGVVYVSGMNTKNEENLWEIRSTAGMVFQNPDNQIVGTVVEEDVAFGPENIGIPPAEIRKRVDQALEMVGISEYSKHAPHLLSGGQKQRIAIAGILAMKPKSIILDEATSMLDPIGRKEVMTILKKLNTEEGITIIHITHHMNEASGADRVIVMEKGEIVMDGKPEAIFSQVECIKKLGLDVPQVTELFYELNNEGCMLPPDVMSIEQAFQALEAKLRSL
jgi:energy-coupling factor transport system ATP-binding protein